MTASQGAWLIVASIVGFWVGTNVMWTADPNLKAAKDIITTVVSAVICGASAALGISTLLAGLFS